MAAPEGYDTPTIPLMDDLAGRKAWFETGNGLPVEPAGYADMESDDHEKVSYDASVVTNNATIAEIQALIDA